MNLYPYTDFHELNDDWIIGHIKKNEKDIAALQNTIANLNFEFDRKADKATTYTKTEVDTLLLGKANLSALLNYYTKLEVDNLLPDMSEYYDSTTIDNMFNNLTLPFSAITNTPGTLAGYGINNAYTQNEVDMMVSSLQTQINQKEVLTKTVTMTIPANQTGNTFTTSSVFDSTYKLIAFNVNYNNDFYFYTNSHTPYFAFLPNSRQISLRTTNAVGDTADRTLEFNVSYKRA